MKGEKKNKPSKTKPNKIGFSTDNGVPNIDVRNTSKKTNNKSSGIPKYVANRMARRIVFTTGIPTISGMAVFLSLIHI